MEGWIKIHRKFLEWEWFDVDEMLKLFIYLLLSANHVKGNWRGINIERGQLITGINSLTEKTKISPMKLRTCLNRLKTTGEITVKSTNKYSIITICNYDSYQEQEQTNNKQLTNNQQTNNKQLTTNKNKENKKNEKKIFVAPTIFEVKEYFKENSYTEISAVKFFNYYDVSSWIDSKNNHISNWKQKAQAVWFTEKNKITKNEVCR